MTTPAIHRLLRGAGFTVRHLEVAPADESPHATFGDRTRSLLMVAVLSGALSADAEEVAAGSALLLAPGDESDAKTHIGVTAETELLVVSLEPARLLDAALASGFVSREVEMRFRAPVARDDLRLVNLARDMRDELSTLAPGRESYTSALVDQLTIHLLREHLVFRHSPALELTRVGLVDRRIRRAVELMHANMDRELTIDEIAAAAHLSPFHFARLFKKLAGATPHAYLASVRAAEAERLLAETDLSVTEISRRVGYASPSHFAKAFRSATGFTPRDFRSALVSL